MSTQSVKNFWKKVESDAALQKRIEGLFQPTDDQPVVKAQEVVSMAKQYGFDFTTDELKDYLVTSGRDVQLSEAELAGVAGGALNAYVKLDSVKIEPSYAIDSSLTTVKWGQGTILF